MSPFIIDIYSTALAYIGVSNSMPYVQYVFGTQRIWLVTDAVQTWVLFFSSGC